MELEMNTKVNCEWTSSATTAYIWLRSLPRVVALDFEAASRYSKADKEKLKQELEVTPKEEREKIRLLRQKIESSGLSHPSLSKVTHLAIGISETEAKVIVFDNKAVLQVVMKWLVTTHTLQLWHNASFDFKHILYNTGQLPKNFEDTQLLAKTLLNHVDVWKSNTQLKQLMGYKYGAWAVAADMFEVENIYDEKLILYAGTDGCATLALWNNLQQYLEDQ